MITNGRSNRISRIKRPFKVLATLVTLWSFLFNMVSYDFAWAARTLLEPTAVGSNRAGGPDSPGLITKDLSVDTFSLPEYLGHIKDVGKGGSGKVMIHIQDAHCNYAAQHKIAEIIEYLNKEYGVDTVNLEGGAKGYDLSTFTRIQDKIIRENTTDYFVKEGLVNGAEYFAINNPEKATLWGIEDTKLYVDNLNVYRDSLKYKDEIDKHLNAITYILSNLKTKIYSQELLDLDNKYSQYKANTLEFKDYLAYLIQAVKNKAIDIKGFTNIYLLSQTLTEEGNIDFKKANNQRDDLIDKLQKKLSKKSLEELVFKTVEFRSEKISQKDFCIYLTKKANLVGIEPNDLPDLQKYIIYISMYNAIDKMKVMEEMERLENGIKGILYQNDKQKELNKLSKNLAILKNIFSISLTKEDYKYYIDNKQSFDATNYVSFINKEAPLYKITAQLDKNITDLDQHREAISKFYEYSFKRDGIFLKNIKFGRKQKIAIVVTGGFHTENLCEIFKKENIAYISIMPAFSNYDGYACPYFNLLAGKEAPLLQKLQPILTSVSSIQIASMLSGAIAPEVWGSANIDAFRAAVLVQEQIAKGRNVVNITREGDDVVFHFENGETERMPIRALLDAVHQKDIDGQMERLSEDAFEDIGNIDKILDEIKEFLRSIGASQEILDRVDSLKGKNADGRAFIRLVRGVTFRGHAGGQGIRINADLKGNEQEVKAVIIHEIIAGLFGDHFLAEMAEQTFRASHADPSLLARAPPLAMPIWNMTPGQRLQVNRDFAQQELLPPTTETRKRLIADKLGISYDKISSWTKANPEKAKVINDQLDAMAKMDQETKVLLQSIDSKYVAIGRNNTKFTNLYTETEEIVRRLLKAAGFNPDNFNFYLLDATEENAFVIRYGNNIFVNIGLVKFIVENGGSKDAIAFVLAHEFKHIDQWVTDCVDGKPLERGLGALMGMHADEYDADHALALIDKAGYSVRDAGFFFSKFLEKKGKPRGISLGFLTHPPTVERLRRIERNILKFFWLYFFNKSEHFSSKANQELTNRSARRTFQEEVAHNDSMEEFMSSLDKADSPEDFIFVLMVSWQKDVHINIKEAYAKFINKFAITTTAGKEIYKIIFDTLEMDLMSITSRRLGGIIIRPQHTDSRELTKKLSTMSLYDLIELLKISILKPMEFDSYNMPLKGIYTFNYPAFASCLAEAIKQKITTTAIADTDINEFVSLMSTFYQRYIELNTYCNVALPTVLQSTLEEMIIRLLTMINEQTKAGKQISGENVDSALYFLDVLERRSSYLQGESVVRILCKFIKNASAANKNKILEWLLKGNAGNPSTFRNYFFEHLARDTDLIDALPGMGTGAKSDLDILFSNSYFTRHSMFSSVGVGEDQMTGGWLQKINILIRILHSLTQKYSLSPEQALELYEYTMKKLQPFTLDSKLENVYNLMYKAMCDMNYVATSISEDTSIPKDLHPEIQKLLYFYKQGGVLSFSDIRGVFFSITAIATRKIKPEAHFTRRDIEVFFSLLTSQANEIKNRYENKEKVKKELRWNKYVLPFALFLAFDGQALNEKESRYESTAPKRHGKADGSVETRPGRPTRFGRFIGEFHSWGLLGRFGSRDDYNKTKVDRGRGINRVFLTGENAQTLLGVFDYIVTSDKDFESLLADIETALPATTYRNFALYILFVEKILKKECGISIDINRMFDLDYIQGIIAGLRDKEKVRAIQLLGRITALMTSDVEMKDLNEPHGNVTRKLEDNERQAIATEHAAEESAYYPAEYTELGGPLSQLDVFVGLLAEEHIAEIIRSKDMTFDQKLKAITDYFPRKSNTRDRLLTMLLEETINRSNSTDMEKALPLLNNENFREKYAVLALEKKRVENPGDFQTVDGELKWILYYFPELSPTRDDMLLQLIDEKANTPSDMQKIRPHLLRAPENVRQRKQAYVIFGSSIFDEYLRHQTAQDKIEFLLWVFGMSNKKPFFIMRFEHEYNVSLNGLRDAFSKKKAGYYKNVGDSSTEEFLERMLLGENGIFYDQKVSDEFLNALFDNVMPSQKAGMMKVVYDAVFKKSDVNRKYNIVVALLKNFARERSTAEGINEARAIRIFLESLGLIGAKMGQFLSTYEDVPEAIRNELKLLKDRAAPISKEVVFDIIAKIYGNFEQSPIAEIFECIGSASIKAVFRARLKDGREVVIKIKRPEVEKKMEEDLEFLQDILSDADVQKALKDNNIEIPKQLGDRITEMIREEMNLRGEVENQARLKAGISPTQTFRKRLVNRIFGYFVSKIFKTPANRYLFEVPVTHDVQNNTLIIEGFVNGKRLSTDNTDAMIAVARELMRQIFVDGFYHADPHTGNIFVANEGSTLFFIDVGSASQISLKNRYILYGLMRALESGNSKKVADIIRKMAGGDVQNLTQKSNDIATSETDVVKKIMMVFKFLEDSNISVDKELISIFRCFGQGESLFRAALKTQWKEGVAVGVPEATVPVPATVPAEEIGARQAATVEAFTSSEGKDNDVKVVIGVSVDMNRADVQPTLSAINRGLAKNGFGRMEDNKQVVTFEIDVTDPIKTAQNQERAMQRATEGLSPNGRVVLFAPQMEKGPRLAGKAQEQYKGQGNITVVPDAYTDSAPDKNMFPDIMVRVALGRNIAFYYTGKDPQGTLTIINNLLAKVADGFAPIATINDLLNLLKPLRIKPVDFKTITDWQKSQESVATAL